MAETLADAPRPVTGVLFDLDDTLYDVPAMKLHVARNIQEYMVTRLGIPQEGVVELCTRCYLEYGTTLAGLVALGYHIDFDDWHAHVHHTLPYTVYLKPDEPLRRMLEAMPHPKHVFTNADRAHAQRCLEILGIDDLFASVIAFEDVQAAAAARGWARHARPVVCKPEHQAYALALGMAGLDAAATVWFDDSTRNIAAGKKVGMYSVLVGRTGVEGTDADEQLQSIHAVPQALPWLLRGARVSVERADAMLQARLAGFEALGHEELESEQALEVAVACSS